LKKEERKAYTEVTENAEFTEKSGEEKPMRNPGAQSGVTVPQGD
jgi:hypothetical protein